MNNYQSTPQNINISPYQQNIDIVKGFFKKPIVLVYAIVSTVLSFFSLCAAIVNFVNSLPLQYYSASSAYYSSISLNLPIAIIGFIFNIILIVSWFMIYFNSKNQAANKTPLIGIKIAWVCAIISLVASSILSAFLALCIFIFMLGALISGTYHSSYTDDVIYGLASAGANIFVAILCIVCAVLIVALIIYAITNLLFLSSVKKSLSSIYLKTSGAKAFGVVNIIFFVFYCIFIIFFAIGVALSFTSSTTNTLLSSLQRMTFMQNYGLLPLSLTSLVLILTAFHTLLMGLIALKYSSYIKSIRVGKNQSFNANNPYSNPVAPAQIMSNNYPQNQEFNPYNPAPAAPVNENPYAQQQPLSPQEPQPPVEQAPQDNVQPTNDAVAPVSPIAPTAPVTENTTAATEGVCPNCGSSVFRSDMFCNNCGTKLK